MQKYETALGSATLLLAGIALTLAIAILILYEADWIIRLGVRLYRRCSTSVDQNQPEPADASKHIHSPLTSHTDQANDSTSWTKHPRDEAGGE
jgi:hypothetical protein